MATYGYSTPYHGIAGGALPQGYMEAATAPGRLLGQGIANLGQGIQSAIAQYQKNRNEEDYLNAKIDAGLAQYTQAALQSGGTMPNGDRADMQTAANVIGEKNAKKLAEGTLSRAEKLSVAHALETYGQTQVQALQRQQLEMAIEQAKKAALGEAEMGSALGTVLGLQPGAQPTIPYRNVASEVLSRYQNLSPSQQITLSGLIQQRTQPTVEQTAARYGMVPSQIKTGEKGIPEVIYEKPVSNVMSSVEIPGSGKLQPLFNNKPYGSPVDKTISNNASAEFESMSEDQKKWVNDQLDKIRTDKNVIKFQEAKTAFDSMSSIAKGDLSPTSSIALIFQFMKSLDPQSSVREGEYATASKAGGIPESVWQAYNNALTGTLTKEKRNMILETSRKALEGMSQSVRSVINDYETQSKLRGVQSKFITESLKQNMVEFNPQPKLERFQSVSEAEANLQPGQSAMVFDPSSRKYREFIKQ